MTNSKSIEFNSEMVKAILQGRKTQTRRVVKEPIGKMSVGELLELKPPYQIGQELRVKESDPKITLEITNIRVERLQDISEDDAKKEGVSASEFVEMRDGSPCYTIPFYHLWTSIYGIDNSKSWDTNPYVWVINFKLKQQKND